MARSENNGSLCCLGVLEAIRYPPHDLFPGQFSGQSNRERRRRMFSTCGGHATSRESLFLRPGMKIKPKAKSATSPPKASPNESFQLRGWPSIAQFLGLPDSTVHRWAKEGMPVRREGRNVVAKPEELNRWLQRTSGEAADVHVVTPGSDLLKDLRSSLTAHKEAKDCFREPKTKRERPAPKASKTKGARKP